MGFDELRHLRNTLAHASVIIGYTSSIMIDAAIFDKPIVGIYFETKNNLLLMERPTEYYKTEHFMKALQTGGIRLARDREDLIRSINGYLENPSLDREGRRRLAEEQCWRLDGKAGERVANAGLEALKLTTND